MNQKQFVDLIAEIESRFPVQSWKYRGIPVWPVARIEARSESLQGASGAVAHGKSNSPKSRWRDAARLLEYAISPLTDRARNYTDFNHEALRLHPTDVLFLGDNASSDLMNGSWRERFNAPVAEAFAQNGHPSLLLQPGKRQRLPRSQPAYSVNWIDRWSRIAARFSTLPKDDFQGFSEFERFLKEKDILLSCFGREAMKQSATRIFYMSRMFDRILARTRPKLVIAVSYYQEIGYALLHACRARGILTVDIQHGGQGGTHEAYNNWHGVPAGGYSVLPSVVWNWSQRDAGFVQEWCAPLKPQHDSLWGGHPQLESWFDAAHHQTVAFDKRIAAMKERIGGDFDILVPLQDLERYTERWEALARVIAMSPSNWRWWLRRHPSAVYNSGSSLNSLLAIDRARLLIEEASTLPLPALLRNVDCVVCLLSSTAFEASEFGHRAVFITEDARRLWPELIEGKQAEVVSDMESLLKRLPEFRSGIVPNGNRPPPLTETAQDLISRATAYKRLTEDQAQGSP